MSRQLTRQTDATTRFARLMLGVAAVLLVARAFCLFLGTESEAELAGSKVPASIHRVSTGPLEPAKAARQPESGRRRLTEQEFASIAGLCPTAVSELPKEILPLSAIVSGPDQSITKERTAPPHHLTSTSAGGSTLRGRLTGIRVAAAEPTSPAPSQPVELADGWLVAPEKWFVPEDQPPESNDEIEKRPIEPTREGAESFIEPPAEPEPASTDLDQGTELDSQLADSETPARPAITEETPNGFSEVPWTKGDSTEKAAETEEPAMTATPVAPVYPNSETSPSVTAADAEASPTSGPSFAPPGVAMPLAEVDESAEQEVSPSRTDDRDETSDQLPAGVREPAASESTTSVWEGPFDAVVPQAESPREERERANTSEERASTDEATGEEPVETNEQEPTEGYVPATATTSDELTDEELLPRAEAVPAPAPAEPERAEPLFSPATRVKPLFAAPPAKAKPSAAPRTSVPSSGQHAALHPGAGPAAAAAAREAAGGKSADESHRELFAKNNYPSAQDCAQCHERIYDEWRVSSHAYAFVSPMYHKFEQTITKLSQGTVGHFCQRCHSPVATAMYEPRSTPIGHMAQVAREGVTCIACHRVNQRWGKSNGDRRIEPGDIYAPVYGGVGGDGVAAAIADKKKYKVKTSPHEKGPGQAIHTEGRFFDQLTKAEACTSCHQVAVHPGVKLEVVWEQYRASPACKKGITCQDCHMGRIPGVAAGYNYGPVAELNGKTVNNHRKQSSHIFYGPGYSIAHPGIFPHNKDAADWTVDEWLLFDWRAGWGTDEFEEKLEELEDDGVKTAGWFPEVWAEADDRYDAREIIGDNLEHLAKKRRYRELVMENGSKVDGPFFADTPAAGRDLKFEYVVANLNEGHNLPTASLGAQPQLWANVVLIDPRGRRVWESGYTDSNGDLCDIHSVDVRKGRIPFDKQLFNLQTMFLITGATGTDREFYLPVNLDIDQVAHLRPGTFPITTLNHPPFIRMEMRSLSPLGKKRVKYTVPAELMRQSGRYRLSFRLRNRTEPMYFMRLCESTPEMLRAMTEGTLDIHPQSVEFEVR